MKKTRSLKDVYGFGPKKLDAHGLRRLILREAAAVMREDADPGKFDTDRFPMTLSAVASDEEQAQANVKLGQEKFDDTSDDDVIAVEQGNPAVTDVKPSQTSMNMPKAMAFALGHIKSGKPGGKLGAFISNDGHIMDGHHRWISSAMVDPSAKLGGSVVNFPATKLIPILNALTVGQFGVKKRKPASGGFDQFRGKSGIQAMNDALDDYLANGSGDAVDKETGDPNPFRLEPEDVTELIEKFAGISMDDGAKDKAIEKFAANLAKLDFSLPDNAPARPDMPVIEKGNNQAAQDALATGQVDVNPPYGEEKVAESRRNSDDVLLERWNKLAGLL